MEMAMHERKNKVAKIYTLLVTYVAYNVCVIDCCSWNNRNHNSW